jgi:hypothetical protein
MIKFEHKGDFSKVNKYLVKVKGSISTRKLEKYGRKGVEALASNTPVDTGLTARSWYYEIEEVTKGVVRLSFCNSNIQNGVPIAIILQYGHGTRNGGWVEGRDYINPAIQPIFDEMAKEAWKEVSV